MQNEMVLLHGWGMNQGVWQVIMPELTFFHDGAVRCLDLPGFGNAQSIPTPYTLHAAAEQLSSELNEGSILVGWSLGGLFALYIAAHWPDKVAKVVLVASTPFFAQHDDWPGIKPDVLNAFKDQLVSHREKTIERFLAIQAMGSESARDDIKQLKLLLNQYPAPKEQALSAGLDILQHDDLRAMFAQLTVPIVGIFGRLDALVPYRALKKMQALQPNFDYEVIDKASHAPFISHKEAFITALKSVC
ncbi:pimeloyl-CoA synthetase [Pseudoalteromonas lipolytica SCSIO 04301]|jgi:pimeloyl-[acyl-carrier protein] methyl ester esterase|uniref:Pimeloyl-[acyl-carrier protein] methyl ester esterase n=1 Tax=Pseudoalteromonas lipolytica TaxID=570156 RepID=A0ABY1GNW6_9GAMM|nr:MULTISPECIES: pimeloyl-ACP methyl ester esterase BioH [Pseudoalteromonas]EWH04719.1 pimeloyl-CoA synthetase [Pseudoalteromonas lipolytica SCSIO 04301]MBE0349491.1 pimeloyl-[acyl-carrier protein] methyl ester esterase [Pseudoalteromonas lipolytica LMEB 39]MCC9661650.1 pimeloyl-ACP methyl ester esterase BioH [Pseudoalteromonas sp. MB41]QLJ08114.1 pimeloyl-ACP methyl ester esterase BioH [Pseudoalteromonas sp. JSTW]SFT76441.1 pimeloyl-[acyl-carrier protein] methyl ester esterase [Pseudoalteromo